MAKAPVRLAVVGLGRAGWDIHIRGIRGREDFVLTDVVDLLPERLEQAKQEFGCRTFSSLASMLKQTDADLVVVATQSKDHARHSLQALAAGKNVLCEKPMATRFSDIDAMIETAKKNKCILTVHQNARLDPTLLHVQEVIKSGKLGRIFAIKRASSAFSRRNDWQTLHKYGGGQLNNNGVHLVDQILQIFDGPVKDVFGDLQQILNPGDVEDHVKVSFRMESGQVADVELAVSALPLPVWMVMGDRGTLVSDGKESKLRYLEGKKKLPKLVPVDATAVEGRRYGVSGGGETLTFVEETLPSVPTAKRPNFYDLLYDTFRNGKPLFVTPESSRRTMDVLRRARKGTAFR